MKKRLTLLSGSWQYFDLAIVLAAVVLGFAVWFIPSVTSSPDVQKLLKQQREIQAQAKAQKEEAARIAKENDELGLVYVPIPAPPEKAKPAQKPKGK